MADRRKVLMLAPFFVPRRRVGALRPYKFAKYLPEFGWEPHVVCFDVQGEELTEFEKKALEHTRVYHIHLPFDRTTKQSKSDISKVKKQQSPEGITQRLIEWLDRQLPVDSWYLLLRFNQSKMENLLKEIKPDILWSTADPWSNLLIGRNLSRKFPLPWVADFRDPWSLCPVRYREKSGHVKTIDQKLEKQVMAEADSVVFTAENTAALYRDRYREHRHKISLIHNAFDSDNRVHISSQERLKNDPGAIKLLFFGKFRSSSPAYVLIRILDEAARQQPGILDGLKVYHLGALTEKERKEAADRNLQDIFETLEPVPYESSGRVFDRVDLLVSILNPERNVVIPAKFWDYLTAETPILSIGDNEEMKEILQKTGTGRQFAFREVEAAADYLSGAIQRIRSGMAVSGFNPYRQKINRYSARSATENLVRLFETLIGNPS